MEIISKDDFYALSPMMSLEIEWEREIIPVIDIVMQVEIKQQLGDLRYIQLLEFLEKDNNECLRMLWNGGKYEDNCGKKGVFDGLKKTVVFYTFAHLIKIGNSYLAQTGFRQFQDTYSNLTSDKNIESNYQYFKNIADNYMADCFKYLKTCETPCGFSSGQRRKFITVIKN